MMIVMLNIYDYQDQHGVYVRNLSSNHLNDDNNVNADDYAFYGGTSIDTDVNNNTTAFATR